MSTKLFETRAEATRAEIRKSLEAKLKTIESGLWEGVEVVTKADLENTFLEPLPEPNEQAAEVTTPARISVYGVCPRCGLGAYLSVQLAAVSIVDGTGGSLKLTAKSKSVNHICGQTTIRDIGNEVEGQTDFELGDIIGEEEEPEGEEPPTPDEPGTATAEGGERVPDSSEVEGEDNDLLPEIGGER